LYAVRLVISLMWPAYASPIAMPYGNHMPSIWVFCPYG